MTFGDRGGRPSDADKKAGSGEGRLVNLPVLKIETSNEHVVELNGKIDRVDAAGRKVAVIDYKSASKKSLEMYLVYWGLALQLPVYALVMESLGAGGGGGGREAIAALYVPLGMKRESVKRLADAADPESDAFYQTRKPPASSMPKVPRIWIEPSAPTRMREARATGSTSASTRTVPSPSEAT